MSLLVRTKNGKVHTANCGHLFRDSGSAGVPWGWADRAPTVDVRGYIQGEHLVECRTCRPLEAHYRANQGGPVVISTDQLKTALHGGKSGGPA